MEDSGVFLVPNPSMPTEPTLIVNFFRANSGREPVRDWLKGMDREDRKRIGEDIKLVQFRWPLGMPLVRKMEADLWEVWTNLGEGNIARVFFTVRGTRMVLLHGLKKKSQKTPRQELELTGACVQESMAQ
uniref:Phage-related protein n=1 Tax=Candidatus Kentrum sp. LPFa TaxID=2126335 RepID=A0A450WAU1_9GAMM|nr:MAG: Phage-related protein [Candidatus Kentron sp. LPFa]